MRASGRGRQGKAQEQPPQQFSVVGGHMAELEGDAHPGKPTLSDRHYSAGFIADRDGHPADRAQWQILRAADENPRGAQVHQLASEAGTGTKKPDGDLGGGPESL